ncbi:MAG: DUF115 domain-containing protein [Desulfobacteraceae bacterium]|nr:MAG: DUF115 domain-containing protein [Desulfobacteraceae bacterium]
MPKLPDFYKINVDLLKKNHAHIWKALAANPPAPAGEVVISPGEKPNLLLATKTGRTGSLHHYEDPAAEAKRFLEMVPENSTGVIVFLGLGLGYAALQLVRQRPGVRHFVLFELNPGIFDRALHLMDLKDLLADRRIILSVGPEPDVPEVMQPAGRALQLENAHLLQHPPSFAIDPEGYKELRDKVYEHVNKLNVSGATSVRFGSDFVANRIRQFTSMHCNSYLLESLGEAFANVPAILVAGGPSLDKNIHLLPRAKGKALIIAVDTVLPALCRQGVLPDFVTSLDPQPLTYEKLASVVPQTKGVSLITVPGTTTRVTKTFPAEARFWLFSARAMERWLNTILGGKSLTAGAGTVAHLNILSAVILKCSPIILVGQDLAFPTAQSHAQGTVLTDKSEMRIAQASDANAMWVEGNDGSKVRTNRAYFSDKEYFERIVAEQARHYINATEGGAYIKGTEVMPLAKVMERFCQDDRDIQGRLRSFRINVPPADSNRFIVEFRAVQKKISEVRKIMRRVEKLTGEVQKALLNISEQEQAGITRYNCFPPEMRRKIEQIDGDHLLLDREQQLWSLVEELTMEGLRQRERMQHQILKLEQEPGQYLAWVAASLKMRQHINEVRSQVLSFLDGQLSWVLKHHAKEKRLRNAADGGQRQHALLELADLYFASEDTVLAQRTLGELLEIAPQDPEVHFRLGRVALAHTDFKKAADHFQEAATADPAMAKREDKIRKEFAGQYLAYAEKYFSLDSGTTKRMLLKGLRYRPGDLELRAKLGLLAARDLEFVRADLSGKNEEAFGLAKEWHQDLLAEESLRAALDRNTVAELHKQYALQLVRRNDYAGAAAGYESALAYAPEDPELHINLAENCFKLGQYPRGIGHVQKAVECDRGYARSWENIGDNLYRCGEVESAIAAYERCFVALPEQAHLLRKIGDCYLALGQPHPAKEAYLQFKSLLTGDNL